MDTILFTRRFAPLLITQFLSIFIDNLFKNALTIYIIHSTSVTASIPFITMITGSVYVLPSLLFSSFFGELVDKYDKALIARFLKLFELSIMVFALIGFASDSIVPLIVLLFLIGVHSTFHNTVKGALLPVHLKPPELMQGNAYIESVTFLAVSIATALGILLIMPHSFKLLPRLLIVLAMIDCVFCWFIPAAPAAQPRLKISHNIFTGTLKLLQYALKHKKIFMTILAMSWFAFISGTLFSTLPTLIRDTLNADGQITAFYYTLFSIGVAVGSTVCYHTTRGKSIQAYLPVAAIGITFCTFNLVYITLLLSNHTPTVPLNLSTFMFHPYVGLLTLYVFFLAASCGYYIVPLNTILQSIGNPRHIGRTISANIIINAATLILAVISVSVFYRYIAHVDAFFLVMGGISVFMIYFVIYKVPTLHMKA